MTRLQFEGQFALMLVQAGLLIGVVVVFARSLKLSKWFWPVVIGFVFQALHSALGVVVFRAAESGWLTGLSDFGLSSAILVTWIIHAIDVFAWLLIVVGLWRALTEIQRRLAT